MKVINLTPHPIIIRVGDDNELYRPSGVVARCSTTEQWRGRTNGIDLIALQFGAVEFFNLEGEPVAFQPDNENIYIVSRIVADAKAYDNFYAVAGVVYDENRRPLYAKGLAFNN